MIESNFLPRLTVYIKLTFPNKIEQTAIRYCFKVLIGEEEALCISGDSFPGKAVHIRIHLQFVSGL
jgi:hypothetical protein